MLAKKREYQKAVELRKTGKSYAEIAYEVPVSKSTLSLWLRSVMLSEESEKILLLRKTHGQKLGGLARKNQRLKTQEAIQTSAQQEIVSITERELWLLGTIAYWCEGSKQKESNVSQRVIFTNSDPILLKLFVRWLRDICKVEDTDILYSIYIYATGDSKKAKFYWSKVLCIYENRFEKIVLKKHNIGTKRKNTGLGYHGLVRITVRKSTNLNRRIQGWISGINNFI